MRLKKILLMRLLSLSKYLCFFIFLTALPIFAEEEDSVDIWKKEIKKEENLNVPTEEQSKQNQTLLIHNKPNQKFLNWSLLSCF